LYVRYYTQTIFVTRLIINKINKVQCVDFKLENDSETLKQNVGGVNNLRSISRNLE